MNSALNLFLASIEKRAFRMARLATRQDDDALELVQEAMLKLVQQYSERPEIEWKPLFYRILENCLTDWHRQQQRQRRWFGFWRRSSDDEESDELDYVEQQDENFWSGQPQWSRPDQQLDRQRQQQQVLALLEQLPLQQQQCFLLRCWEGMSVQETADALGISTGSVKTHLHRVRQKLETVTAEYEYEHDQHGRL